MEANRVVGEWRVGVAKGYLEENRVVGDGAGFLMVGEGLGFGRWGGRSGGKGGWGKVEGKEEEEW